MNTRERLNVTVLLAIGAVLLGLFFGLTARPLAAPMPASKSPGTWSIENADNPHFFEHMTADSMVLDSQGYPHIAYGGKHLYHAWWDGSEWHTEIVDNANNVGAYASLVLGWNDTPYISYYDGSTWMHGNLKLAHRTDSGWVIETVDSAGDVGQYTSLVLGGTGNLPYISYYDATNKALKLAHLTTTNGWIIETVDAGDGNKSTGMGTSLSLEYNAYFILKGIHISYTDGSHTKYAHWSNGLWDIQEIGNCYDYDSTDLTLDGDKYPHIVYADQYIHHVYWTGSEWNDQTVSGAFAENPSLKLDSSGNPHISYTVNVPSNIGTEHSLHYVYWTGSAWNDETVDDIGIPTDLNPTRFTSLVLDSGGRPHIAYMNFSDHTHTLKHAQWTGSDWDFQAADDARSSGAYSSLVLDSQNQPHISHYDALNYVLLYTHRSGNTWSTEVADNGKSVGGYSSLALDSANRPHISYYDGAHHSLRYAHLTASGWLTETVESGNAGTYTSLALDSNDNPRISYNNDTGGLKYARWNGIGWDIQTVDGDGGAYTSLVLDGNDYPNIGYVDYNTGAIKFAQWTNLGWNIETVESGDANWCASLALDRAGEPHFAYVDVDLGLLKYAYRDGQGWHIQNLIASSASQKEECPTLTLDTADRPHIAYFDPETYTLQHVYLGEDGATWEREAVDNTPGSGYYPSIASDKDGGLHIAYIRLQTNDGWPLLYAYLEPGTYSTYLPLIRKP